MPSFGRNSKQNVSTVTTNLQKVLAAAIKEYDFSVIFGHRDRATQDKAYADKNSTKKWPNSKHNFMPSQAFDVIPYPDGWKASNAEFCKMAEAIIKASEKVGVPLRWGGDWDGDGDITDQNLIDLAHFEETLKGNATTLTSLKKATAAYAKPSKSTPAKPAKDSKWEGFKEKDADSVSDEV